VQYVHEVKNNSAKIDGKAGDRVDNSWVSQGREKAAARTVTHDDHYTPITCGQWPADTVSRDQLSDHLRPSSAGQRAIPGCREHFWRNVTS